MGREDFSTTDDDVSSSGFYALAACKVIPNLQPVVKYDFWDSDSDIDDNEITKVALGLNYLATPAAKLQLLYEIKNEPKGFEYHNNDFIAQWGVTF
jgi:hypothetical protein